METTQRSLAVGRRDSGVFVHPLNTPASGAVGAARHINPHGPAVGSNPQDRFVVYMVQHIWIITTSGGVYAHKYGLKSFPYREVDAAFRVSGDVEPVDGSGPFVLGTMLGTKIRFAAAQENRLLFFRNNGEVVGYEFDGLPSGASA